MRSGDSDPDDLRTLSEQKKLDGRIQDDKPFEILVSLASFLDVSSEEDNDGLLFAPIREFQKTG
jgi:hypothetical protein